MVKISSWGHLTAAEHDVRALSHTESAQDALQKSPKPLLACGMRRSYGDVCLNPDAVLFETRGLNRFLSFDDTTGILRCEPGTLLKEIQALTVPRGWILPVTPGTQLITVGGAIANDVHGKNHHVFGTFGDHVLAIQLTRTTGETITCSPVQRPDWFAATVGGLGLTGVITQVTLQLRRISSPWLDTETLPFSDLKTFFDLSDASEKGFEHTVSWIDCTSNTHLRGLFMRANFTTIEPVKNKIREKSLNVPITPPFSLLNRYSLRPFNTAYYYLQTRKPPTAVMHYQPFFYPLDAVSNWNRIYGPKGFFQYQAVLPRETGYLSIQSLLHEISASGQGSFLAVLKTFGDRRPLGMLSFPCKGVTLALDFPNLGDRTLRLFERLDAIIREHKGRIYPAKDARMPRDIFEASYPRLDEFLKYRDPGISSAFSRRVMGR